MALSDISVKVFGSVKTDWANNSHHISLKGKGNKAFTGSRFILETGIYLAGIKHYVNSE